jgi:hypothetical protein
VNLPTNQRKVSQLQIIKAEAANMEIKISRESIVKVAGEQVSCDLAGEAVILSLTSGQYFGLNEVGARIWKLIQEPKSVEVVFEALLQDYDVTRDQLEREVLALLEKMAINQLIELKNGKSL